MQVITLNAENWKHPIDFYVEILPALGAPEWHGTSADALIDSMIWGGINTLEPPYVVRVLNGAKMPPAVSEEVHFLEEALRRHRLEYRRRNGRDVAVEFEIQQ
jgi:hypothetical protein